MFCWIVFTFLFIANLALMILSSIIIHHNPKIKKNGGPWMFILILSCILFVAISIICIKILIDEKKIKLQRQQSMKVQIVTPLQDNFPPLATAIDTVPHATVVVNNTKVNASPMNQIHIIMGQPVCN